TRPAAPRRALPQRPPPPRLADHDMHARRRERRLPPYGGRRDGAERHRLLTRGNPGFRRVPLLLGRVAYRSCAPARARSRLRARRPVLHRRLLPRAPLTLPATAREKGVATGRVGWTTSGQPT